MKRAKIYELYYGDSGVTCQSAAYDRYSKQIWHVSALSIKQAYYFASNNIWLGDQDYTPLLGIVEYSKNASNAGWDDFRGNHYWSAKYRHNQSVSEKTVNKLSPEVLENELNTL